MLNYHYVIVIDNGTTNRFGPYLEQDVEDAAAQLQMDNPSGTTYLLNISVDNMGFATPEMTEFNPFIFDMPDFSTPADEITPSRTLYIKDLRDIADITSDPSQEIVVDLNGRSWELFTASMDTRIAAAALNEAATDALGTGDPAFAAKIWTKTSERFAEWGAADSEPRNVFHQMHALRFGAEVSEDLF